MQDKLKNIAYLQINVSVTTEYEGTKTIPLYITNEDYIKVDGYVNSLTYDLDSP